MVVAGARGAGKSTFLKALIAGEIGAKVLPNVPRRAGLWQEFDPTKYREWMPWVTASDGERKRVALHCDLLDCLLGLNAPALDLFGLARKVTLVAIKPDLARLTAQYANRESSGVLGLLGKGEAPESLWKAVNPKRDAASLTLVNPGEWIERMADGRRRVLAGYAKPGWIDRPLCRVGARRRAAHQRRSPANS